MEGSAFVRVKRGRSDSKSDVEFIKTKRRETPADTVPKHVKEEAVDKSDGYGDEDDINDDKSINEEGVEDTRNKSRRTEYKEEEHPGMHVSHGCYFVEGKMKHGMEDYVVATQKKVDGFEVGLYAIFDGHSGQDVAEYLQSHLFDNILNEPDFWTNPKSAVKRAYKVTDDDILENLVSPKGGSTASTAILINREKLVMANVGDSRAVLCKNGKPNQITVDHDPLKEKELVESRGGFVSKMPGNVPRVDGQLSMTRAFGDERLKNHITAEPHVVIEKIDEHTEFIILASDGLWKVMSNQEAVDCISEINDGQEAAEELIKEALSRGSQDDISCVVVMFE